MKWHEWFRKSFTWDGGMGGRAVASSGEDNLARCWQSMKDGGICGVSEGVERRRLCRPSRPLPLLLVARATAPAPLLSLCLSVCLSLTTDDTIERLCHKKCCVSSHVSHHDGKTASETTSGVSNLVLQRRGVKIAHFLGQRVKSPHHHTSVDHMNFLMTGC